MIYANKDYDDVIENVLEYEEPPYANNWLIAWAYNGSYWSNPYTRENGLLDSYFENMDSNYSIHPWTGSYYKIGTIGDYISMDWNFSSNFGNKITSLEIQEGITEIGENAFAYLNISYVYIPNSVQAIHRHVI